MRKPVWRVNTGQTPSDSKEYPVILFGDGDLSLGNTHFSEWAWQFDRYVGAAYRIAAYETNRTRKAKYEQVECNCESGFIYERVTWSGDSLPRRCERCNGKGYQLARGEA